MKKRTWRWFPLLAILSVLFAAGTVALLSAGPTNNSTCTVSTELGLCGPYTNPSLYGSGTLGPTYVLNGVWNPLSGFTDQTCEPGSAAPCQTISVPGTGSKWTVVADYPDTDASVHAYPNSEQHYTLPNGDPIPLSSFTSLISSFNETMPTGSSTVAEAAYDIWMGQNASTKDANEVMIWNQEINEGICDGDPIEAKNVTFGGSDGIPSGKWDLCANSEGPRTELIWLFTGNESSGSVNVLQMLDWLINHGYLPKGIGLNNIGYGFELCSTGSQFQTYTLNNFTITAISERG